MNSEERIISLLSKCVIIQELHLSNETIKKIAIKTKNHLYPLGLEPFRFSNLAFVSYRFIGKKIFKKWELTERELKILSEMLYDIVFNNIEKGVSKWENTKFKELLKLAREIDRLDDLILKSTKKDLTKTEETILRKHSKDAELEKIFNFVFINYMFMIDSEESLNKKAVKKFKILFKDYPYSAYIRYKISAEF